MTSPNHLSCTTNSLKENSENIHIFNEIKYESEADLQ